MTPSSQNKPILHHTPEVEDMRQSFRPSMSCRSKDESSSKSSTSASRSTSDGSYRSYRTQPTDCSSPSEKMVKEHKRNEDKERYFQDRVPQESPRASIVSIASSIQSDDDRPETADYAIPAFSIASRKPSANSIPSTPTDFSILFPSERRIYIHHDETTEDGNMNLRLDTEVDLSDGRRAYMTLFHLRMHDLRTRTFSLRRHCRDSGREVCHTSRREQTTGMKRPTFHRSLSNALQAIRPKLDDKHRPVSFDLKRHDSGYVSIHTESRRPSDARPATSSGVWDPAPKPAPILGDTIRMEFTNYAQAEVKRVRSKGHTRYDFQYWGISYSWKRIVRKDLDVSNVSYHLTRSGHDSILARIEPEVLAPYEAEEERRQGGWISPSSFFIVDNSIISAQKDVSDVMVASGLMALVDDSIHAHFYKPRHKDQHRRSLATKLGVDAVNAKRMLSDMLRRDSDSTRRFSSLLHRPSTSQGSSAFITADTSPASSRPVTRGVIRQLSSHV